jgi:putative resolvase
MTEKTYSTGKFGKLIGISNRTLQRWDVSGRLVSHKTATGRRFYTEEQYRDYMKIAPDEIHRKVVCYTRVSESHQKKDLQNQINALETFTLAQGKTVDEWLSDIGSGLNTKRESFVQLMKDVDNGIVSEIMIAHKDRLVRIGYGWFESFCKSHDCKLTVANLQGPSPEEDTQDLLAIIDCFSPHLYGLRRNRKEINRMVSETEMDTQ